MVNESKVSADNKIRMVNNISNLVRFALKRPLGTVVQDKGIAMVQANSSNHLNCLKI